MIRDILDYAIGAPLFVVICGVLLAGIAAVLYFLGLAIADVAGAVRRALKR